MNLFPREMNIGFIGLVLLLVVVVINVIAAIGVEEQTAMLILSTPVYAGLALFLLIYSHLEQRY